MLAFLDGTLRPERRPTVEAHIAACTACADIVTWAAADQASTDRLPGHEGRPFVGQLQPGARVGRYQVLGAVGRGGMGEVYAAYHPDLDRRIALKVVHELGGDTSERRGRLLREARAIARLSHPNVVSVHDAGTFGDRVFIAMEFVDGTTVDEWLHAASRTWREILDVFIAAGRGLAAAHAADVIHRDFKPQNVMIARNGAVRVMDFGLARLAQDGAAHADALGDSDSPLVVPIDAVTKTGALVGTPAYMSPEQFKREPIDARSDQFSFCVALHEALFGSRPEPAVSDIGSPATEPPKPSQAAAVPGWLRNVMRRGASPEKEKRYPSMDALLAGLERGGTRTRQRSLAIGAGLAVLLVVGAGWRLARGNRLACAIPKDRVAAAWAAGDANDPRRQSVHRTFAASGGAAGEKSWSRLSEVLDAYVNSWGAMYVQTCEATHIRGEQSAEVLDLRMSCLNDNLDQVRALADALVTADRAAISRAITAALDLTPVARCGDIAMLKSAVPLPRDERTLREVLRLRKSIREAETLREIGRFRPAFAKAAAIRPEVEATRFKPLLGELLLAMGMIQVDLFDREAEKTLEEAVFVAEASHDDVTMAKAATSLSGVTAVQLSRFRDAERWSRLASAVLDRLGAGHSRIRAWALNNNGVVLCMEGKCEAAKVLLEEALVLKEADLGKGHPDVAISLVSIVWALIELDRAPEALDPASRALAILEACCDPSGLLAGAVSNKAEVLHLTGRNVEARGLFHRAIRVAQETLDSEHPVLVGSLDGLGEIELAEGNPVAAIPFLEKALHIIERTSPTPAFQLGTRYSLAKALWESRVDRPRALRLAEAAREAFARSNRPRQEREVATWLASHRPPARNRQRPSP